MAYLLNVGVPTNEFKFLGITIDNRLTWKLHITILASHAVI